MKWHHTIDTYNKHVYSLEEEECNELFIMQTSRGNLGELGKKARMNSIFKILISLAYIKVI